MDPVQRLLHICQAVYDAGTSEPGNWAAMQKPLVRLALETIEEIAAQPRAVSVSCADCDQQTAAPIYWCGTSARCPDCHAKRMRGVEGR